MAKYFIHIYLLCVDKAIRILKKNFTLCKVFLREFVLEHFYGALKPA